MVARQQEQPESQLLSVLLPRHLNTRCDLAGQQRSSVVGGLKGAAAELRHSAQKSYSGDGGGPHNRPPLLLWLPHIILVILKILKYIKQIFI